MTTTETFDTCDVNAAPAWATYVQHCGSPARFFAKQSHFTGTGIPVCHKHAEGWGSDWTITRMKEVK